MPGRAVHFALKEEELDSLLSTPSDEERLEVLTEEIEENLFEKAPERVYQSDKAWYAIHLAMSSGAAVLPHLEDAELAIMGGEDLYHRDDFVMSLKTPEEARRVGEVLGALSEEEFRSLYEGIPEDEHLVSKSDQDFRYTWEYLEGLAEFFRRSGDAELSVLFTVDP
jgi:hypothetical protein